MDNLPKASKGAEEAVIKLGYFVRRIGHITDEDRRDIQIILNNNPELIAAYEEGAVRADIATQSQERKG